MDTIQKVEFIENEPFTSLHSRMKKLVGKSVLPTLNAHPPYEIVSVSPISAEKWPDYKNSFQSFLQGDESQIIGNGYFAFKTDEYTEKWAFDVAVSWNRGDFSYRETYKFAIPRHGKLVADDCIFWDPVHPFIHCTENFEGRLKNGI